MPNIWGVVLRITKYAISDKCTNNHGAMISAKGYWLYV